MAEEAEVVVSQSLTPGGKACNQMMVQVTVLLKNIDALEVQVMVPDTHDLACVMALVKAP